MNKKAEERKKRFVEAKVNAGGLDYLLDDTKPRSHKVFFNDLGEIVCVTNAAQYEAKPEWNTHPFTHEEIMQMLEKGDHNFQICPHPMDDSKYIMVERLSQSTMISANEDFVSEVLNDEDPDLICELTGNSFSIKLTPKAKRQYEGVYPISATAMGKRLLYFYITAKSDPHTMVQYEEVSLASLLTKDKITFTTMHDYIGCSIYTQKVFPAYALVEHKGIIYGKD